LEDVGTVDLIDKTFARITLHVINDEQSHNVPSKQSSNLNYHRLRNFITHEKELSLLADLK
jgi:hypothetical protein